ncbi:hypothetical protein EAE91_22890 [Photorhabdus noenieputensis]|uniref:hypothetical protein n=1 Tax=Photorhabdus noenieputensis TaxID=1208607 RepID=UPI001BD1C0F0|nr:hypothetical protein [Photorhabdus noenieputensis]MBS9439889.1 hypothetical protein [Photorhabdus noenieputensis]MCK3668964.1 hypothetical protein [Photorhabdus noenieputensis]
MAWDIPQSYSVHRPEPPVWSLWWRLFSLACFAVVVAVGSFWYLFKDPASLLYALVALAGITALFGVIAGWRLFRYGVELEQAEVLTQENAWQEARWQAWASQAIRVVDYGALFPPEVPSPADKTVLVNGDSALALPPFSNYLNLFKNLLGAVRSSLAAHVVNHKVNVYFPLDRPEAVVWEQFCQVWKKLGLPLSQLQGPVKLNADYTHQISDWLTTETKGLLLVITWCWEGNKTPEATSEGAVVWLLAPSSSQLSAKCCLHRPMATVAEEAEQSVAQLLRYQCPAITAGTLWYNDADSPEKDRLLIRLNQRLKALPSSAQKSEPTTLDQQFVPHWLGKSGPYADWFALTLAMKMAEYQQVPQLFLLAHNTTLQLGTISPLNNVTSSGDFHV